MEKKVLVLTNSINGLYSFRRELIQKLLDHGHEIVISAPNDEKTVYFTKIGCKCIESPISRRGKNPITDFKLFLSYLRLLNAIKPKVVLTYTIKPNVYGGLACSLLKVPYIANITGLGTSLENKGLLQRISLLLYKFGLTKTKCVFFQNEDNQKFFIKNNIIRNKSRLIPGSGVNLERYSFEVYPSDDKFIKFLFIGRLMRAKGILELLEAAKKVKEKYPNVQFDLIGRVEENTLDLLKESIEEKIVNYHGPQNDVHSFIKNSHAIINPSYHEGMSNVLLESASTGRPILASNIPGCIETFDEKLSGLGFEVRDVDSLVNTIFKFIELPYSEKKNMGIAGRRKMENEFDRKMVVKAYLEEIKMIIDKENNNEPIRENS